MRSKSSSFGRVLARGGALVLLGVLFACSNASDGVSSDQGGDAGGADAAPLQVPTGGDDASIGFDSAPPPPPSGDDAGLDASDGAADANPSGDLAPAPEL